uniref:SUMO protease putative n=1 Tax=Albugo laibachii Nc14 TaxID=890382 RepID=F0W6S7_9STRA|nr:SUMO protease putative [Albugo laibachii Nc14]|eukprot:CCA16822.1 SUMO protease putative [Albugo laibachii Nc14]
MASQVINLRDAQMYDSDVALFTEFTWLNDNAIHFYFEYIHQFVCNASSRVLFVDPAVVSCLLLQCDEDEELMEMICGWNLHEKELCVFPVNDRKSSDEYGTHWSLIVFHKNENQWEHYDSSEPSNQAAAIRAYGMLQRVFQLSMDTYDTTNCELTQRPCRQQENNYDCGMHVLLVAEYLSKKHFGCVDCSLQEYVNPERIRDTRLGIPSLIKRLRSDG